MYGSVEEGIDKDGVPTMRVRRLLRLAHRVTKLWQVMGAVDLKHTQEHELTLEWDSSASNDMIADATLALVTGIDKSPASVKCRCLYIVMSDLLIILALVTSSPHSHSKGDSHQHPHADHHEDTALAIRTRIGRIAWFLEAHFGEVELHMPESEELDATEQGEENEPSLLVELDEANARVNLVSLVSLIYVPFV